MFKNLSDFSYKRSGGQVFGFYVAWLGVVILTSMPISLLLASLTGQEMDSFAEGYAAGLKVGAVIAFIVCTGLSVLISVKKKLLGEFKTTLLIICTALLAVLGGGLFGLIIPAYLSTREMKGVVG